jgi:hypothetical protein
MPLLEIKATKKVTAICSLEESTALLVDQYAAFAKAPADEVVNKAIEYVCGKDSEFQKYRVQNPKPAASLRLKRSATVATGARRGPKPGSASPIAAD